MPGYETSIIAKPCESGGDWDAMRIRRSLSADALAALIRPDPWVSILSVLANAVAIAALVGVGLWAGLWWVTVLAMILIAGRQHAMLVLMHDASHRLIHPNARINDLVSNLFLSFPLLVSTAAYRAHHMAHHRFVNSDKDPDLNDAELPPNLVLFLLQLLGDMLGLRSLRLLASVNDFGVFGLFKRGTADRPQLRSERRLFVAFCIVATGVLTVTGGWSAVLLYWVVPMWFFLPPVLHLRAAAEHGGRHDAQYLRHARSVDPYWPERLVLCPFNINLHLEHHIFPDIPSHRLPQVSRLLEEIPDLGSILDRNKGYLLGANSVLADLFRPDTKEHPA